MKYVYRETEVFYKFINRKREETNVFLHGWGCDCQSLFFCQDCLKNQNALFVDFPPFGKSGKIRDWSIFTYANMLISLCQHLKLKKFNLIGHSFGGRVAIIVATLCKAETNKLVLVDSAGLKPKRGLNYYIKVYTYKIKKKLNKNTSNYGSCDYRVLGEDMRKVFVSVVNTRLDEFLPLIEADALIVFGECDKVTPIYMAKRFNKKIKNSKLVVLKGAGHFPFLDKRAEFVSILKNYIGG